MIDNITKSIGFILFSVAILVPAPAPAEMPEGASDPAFQDAVEVWLSDDDATSLPALFRLARGGNRAAQILLGQIELHEPVPSPWIAALSRSERRALFRAPDGKFGKPWLAVAAEHSELARALYAARDFEQMNTVVPALYALGEFRAMGPALSRLISHGEWDTLVALGSQGVLPTEHLHAAWYGALHARNAEAARFMQDSVAAIRENDPELATILALSIDLLNAPNSTAAETAALQDRWLAYGRRLGYPPEFTGDFTGWLLESDANKQIASVCSTLCPAQTKSCAATAWSMLGGYQTNLELGSPVATLIPTARYVQSERAIGELLRRIGWFPSGSSNSDAVIRSLAGDSRCLADHLKTVRLR